MSLLDLKNINGNNGFIIPGKIEDDRIGTEVYSTGDINGDGIDDAIVTATNAGIANSDPYSYSYSDRRGKAYVIFGSRNGYDTTFDLDNLNGNNGFTITGIEENHELGNAISAGDINGDGIDDLVVAASYAGDAITGAGFTYSNNKGEVYVVFGRQNSFAADFKLQSLNGNNGFKLRGIDAEDMLGTAITSAGDINGDGINDLAISASGAGQLVTNSANSTTSDRRGEVFVVFGKRDGLNSQINLARLNGNNGFIIEGIDPNNSLGEALSNAGDINGDGIDDLIIGSPNGGEVLNSPFADGDSDQRGEVDVIFGSRNGFNSRFNLEDRPNGVNGFTISGTGIEDNLGSAISNAGDLNGDGIDDLILGAAKASVGGEYTQSGQVYVVFGRRDSFGNQFDLNSLNGSNGFSIAGINPGDGLGNAVSAGDFNGDGIDDLFVGANTAGETISAYGYDYSDRRGEAYIVFGKSNFAEKIDLANLDSNAGSKIVGINSDDLLGSAISSGGDINGDGADDLIVSAPDVDLGEEYSREGTTYVIFGSPEDDVAQPQPQPVPQPVPQPQP
ncbi:MAG: calcium-binding protein, partial [Waterburya sp.]